MCCSRRPDRPGRASIPAARERFSRAAVDAGAGPDAAYELADALWWLGRVDDSSGRARSGRRRRGIVAYAGLRPDPPGHVPVPRPRRFRRSRAPTAIDQRTVRRRHAMLRVSRSANSRSSSRFAGGSTSRSSSRRRSSATVRTRCSPGCGPTPDSSPRWRSAGASPMSTNGPPPRSATAAEHASEAPTAAGGILVGQSARAGISTAAPPRSMPCSRPCPRLRRQGRIPSRNLARPAGPRRARGRSLRGRDRQLAGGRGGPRPARSRSTGAVVRSCTGAGAGADRRRSRGGAAALDAHTGTVGQIEVYAIELDVADAWAARGRRPVDPARATARSRRPSGHSSAGTTARPGWPIREAARLGGGAPCGDRDRLLQRQDRERAVRDHALQIRGRAAPRDPDRLDVRRTDSRPYRPGSSRPRRRRPARPSTPNRAGPDPRRALALARESVAGTMRQRRDTASLRPRRRGGRRVERTRVGGRRIGAARAHESRDRRAPLHLVANGRQPSQSHLREARPDLARSCASISSTAKHERGRCRGR